MSTEKDKVDPPAVKPQGTGLKKLQTALGVASAATIVMSFIPGVNDIGAVVQGVITLAQTAIDLKQSGFRKAALTFATGSILTGMMLIPFLGAAGKLAVIGKDAMEVEVAAKSAKDVEEAVQRTNILQKITGFAGDVVKGAKEQAGKLFSAVNKIPPVGFITKHANTLVIEPVKNTFAPIFEKSRALQIDRMGWVNANPALRKVTTALAADNGKLAGRVGTGLMVGSFVPALIPNGGAKDLPDINPDARPGHLASLKEREAVAAAGLETTGALRR